MNPKLTKINAFKHQICFCRKYTLWGIWRAFQALSLERPKRYFYIIRASRSRLSWLLFWRSCSTAPHLMKVLPIYPKQREMKKKGQMTLVKVKQLNTAAFVAMTNCDSKGPHPRQRSSIATAISNGNLDQISRVWAPETATTTMTCRSLLRLLLSRIFWYLVGDLVIRGEVRHCYYQRTAIQLRKIEQIGRCVCG